MLSGLDVVIGKLLADGSLAQFRVRVVYRLLVIFCIIGSTGIAIVDTVPDFWGSWHIAVHLLELSGLILLCLDYLFRLRLAWLGDDSDEPEQRGLHSMTKYALSAYGIFDFLAVFPFLLEVSVLPLSPDGHTVFGILRFLKLARYSPAIEILGTAVLEELKPLASALFIIALLAIAAATSMYFAERTVNEHFRTVPDALWWAIITLTTVGYGDVVPMSVLGKILNSFVAVLGLCMFALPASILATGFSEEMKRRNFMSTWTLVAKVPMFSGMHAGQIAEIASLLRPQRVSKGDVVVREGDVGDTMYFIVAGQLEARTPHGNFILRPGDFFGEIAMVERNPRTATVVATTRSQLLELAVLDFQRFVGRYPELLEVIRKTAKSRLKQ